MAVDPAQFSDSLRRQDDGTWTAPDDVAVSYPSGGHQSCFELEPTSFWFNHRNRCIVDLVRNNPPPGPVFDIGGGNGYVTAALVAAGFEAALVEPGAEGVHNAAERGVAVRIQAEAQNAGFRASSLPAVGLFDVLEHVEDDAGMVRWISERLVEDGMLYLTVPAYGWLWSSEDEHAGHYRRYTRGQISGLLAATGFARSFASYFFRPLVPPIFLLRTVPTRIGLRTAGGGDRAASEHAPPGGRVLAALLGREARQMARGRPVPFGSSLLVAARKR